MDARWRDVSALDVASRHGMLSVCTLLLMVVPVGGWGVSVCMYHQMLVDVNGLGNLYACVFG